MPLSLARCLNKCYHLYLRRIYSPNITYSQSAFARSSNKWSRDARVRGCRGAGGPRFASGKAKARLSPGLSDLAPHLKLTARQLAGSVALAMAAFKRFIPHAFLAAAALLGNDADALAPATPTLTVKWPAPHALSHNAHLSQSKNQRGSDVGNQNSRSAASFPARQPLLLCP